MQDSTLTVDTLSQFVETVRRHFVDGVVYRGVTDSAHRLIPSLARGLVSPTPQVVRGLCSKESAALRLFKLRSHLYYNVRLPLEDLDLLALAQHYGLPTRLLDWTFNPLVALFFAVRGTKGNAGAVYALADVELVWAHLTPYPINPFSQNEVIGHVPNHIDSRMTAQDTVFTVHPPPWQAFESPGIHRIMIPDAAKPVIRRDLRICGVHEQTLFPGLTGLADFVRITESIG